MLRHVAPLAVALAACAHGPSLRVPGEERLVAIHFEGNKQLSGKTLETGLALHRVEQRGGAPDPYLVQVDTDRLRGEYLRKGYLDVDVRSRVERKGDAATVTYTVEEGVRATTRTVINGLPPDLAADTVRAELPLKDGQPFDYEPFDLAKPKLVAVIQNAGYAHAALDATVIADRANHTAIIELDYTPGPKCTFGGVEVSGATGELADAVRNRVTFTPGQTYSAQAIVQTQRNLYGLGRFSTVNVQPDKTGGDVVGVKIAVAEGAPREIKLGGGLGIDPEGYEIRGRAGYSIVGWPFPLDTASIDLRPAYALQRTGGYEPRIRALGRLERQDLLWTYARGIAEAGYNYLTVEAFTRHGPVARLGFETRLGTPKVTLRVGWSFERDNFRNVSPAILARPDIFDLLKIDTANQVGAYQQAIVADLRDSPLEPRLGAYGELRTTEGTRFAGGNYEFLEVMPDVRGYLPVFDGVVLAARAKYGAVFGDVPAVERLFLGGATSQRGFSERRLAPSVPDTMSGGSVPYGGGALIDTSVEARVPITKIRQMPLGGVVFLDGGDVTEKPSELRPAHLHWAAGAGLRLSTAVGPVRLDVAYRLNRTGMGEPDPGSNYTYHLTIGEAF